MDLTELDGVTDVTYDDDRLHVGYTDSESKATVIHRLVESDARVVDFETEEATLGDLFSAFTETDGEAVASIATDGGEAAIRGARR